jgi:hypothetical protein
MEHGKSDWQTYSILTRMVRNVIHGTVTRQSGKTCFVLIVGLGNRYPRQLLNKAVQKVLFSVEGSPLQGVTTTETFGLVTEWVQFLDQKDH